MLALALDRGHISPTAALDLDDDADDGREDVLPVTSVVVMTAGC